MPEEWFEVAYINYDKAILHGRARVPMLISNGEYFHNTHGPKDIEQVLTDEQKNAIVDMNERHQDEMQALLKSFVDV